MRTPLAYVVTWLLGVAVATGVGFWAINLIGDVLHGSGPIGAELQVQPASPTPTELTPTGPVRQETFVYGPVEMTVSCRGRVARVDSVEPRDPWRITEVERGPDEDVDATLRHQRDTFQIEVYCNRGRPSPVIETDTARS